MADDDRGASGAGGAATFSHNLARMKIDLGKTVPSPWEHADSDALRGLEAWGRELAERDLRAGLRALLAFGRKGFPTIVERAGDAIESMGFLASEPSLDGLPVEAQLETVAKWLDAPESADVKRAFDPSRQLNVWDDDLRPSDDQAWYWYYELGQCACAAILNQGKGSEDGASYDTWPPAWCVARGLVIAVRGLRTREGEEAAIIDELSAGLEI